MSKKNIFASKTLLFALLLFLSTVRPLNLTYINREQIFSRGFQQRFGNLKHLYDNSQYVKKDNPGIIPDEELEAFAGGAFLKGINPILIVHDQPPLGRYIIALSIWIFDNETTIPILLWWVSALGLYLVAKQVLKNSMLALIPTGIFMNEPLFISKLSLVPLLEPIQLPFIIFAIFCFLRSLSPKNAKQWIFGTALMLGAVIGTRFFILGGVLALSMAIFLVIRKKYNLLFQYSLSLPVMLLVLVASYWKTLESGYSVINIFAIQRYILEYHKSALVDLFSFWDLILFNRWHTWWGSKSISFDQNWIALWPIAMCIVVAGLVFFKRKKMRLDNNEFVLVLWVLLYSLLMSVGYASTRYFLPLLPFLYILSTSFILKLLKVIKASR